MDHDSVPFDIADPASYRIADVLDAYLGLTRRGLAVLGEMIGSEPAYESNEDGHFSWAVSLMIRAGCLTWRVTVDPVHLGQAVNCSQHMVERTDEARGLTNW